MNSIKELKKRIEEILEIRKVDAYYVNGLPVTRQQWLKEEILSLIKKETSKARREERERTLEEVLKGVKKWAKKSKKHKWLKFATKDSYPDDAWYDWDEVWSSIMEHVGYFKMLSNLNQTKKG